MKRIPQFSTKYLYLIGMLVASISLIVALVGMESQFDNAKALSSEDKIIDSLNIEVGDKPNVLVWTSAKWCSLCSTMRQAVAETGAEFSAQIEVIEIDIDENPQMLQAFPTSAPPTFYLFNRNRDLVLTFGAEEKNSFRARLLSYIDLRTAN
jgi:thiol-disulfide isomerase/thioredoxin